MSSTELQLAASQRTSLSPMEQASRKMRMIWIGRVLFLIVFLLIWQVASPYLDKTVFSSPADIARNLVESVLTGSLWPNLWTTLEEIALGYIVGAFAGIVVGFILGSNEIVAGILDPVMIAIYGIPKIALGPLFVVWFGINLMPKVVMAAVIVFFVVFYATYHGVREVDQDMLRTIQLLGVSPTQIRRWVIFPSALSAIFLGLKMAVPEALVGAVVGEMIVSNKGLGYMIQFAATQLDTAGVYAGLFVLMIMALLANSAVNQASGMKRR
ncbi:MAG: ABC transporter permease [Alicyclobacillus sp.]|nr:ABC transporter permease [Alicyclobacillus sp.]